MPRRAPRVVAMRSLSFLLLSRFPFRSPSGTAERMTVHISADLPVNYTIRETKSGSPAILVPTKKPE